MPIREEEAQNLFSKNAKKCNATVAGKGVSIAEFDPNNVIIASLFQILLQVYPNMSKRPYCILVMGVSGSGKSLIGRELASSMAADFIDADDHHSAASIAKMSYGKPLNDGDRKEWLMTLSDFYRQSLTRGESLVIGCSALKRRYRDILRNGAPELRILYLHGERATLLERLNSRQSHFFRGDKMLDSQLSDLEPPCSKEALRIDIGNEPAFIIKTFLDELNKALHPESEKAF